MGLAGGRGAVSEPARATLRGGLSPGCARCPESGEASGDETSAAALEGEGDDVTQKSLVILSQDVHRVFGGVVPEIGRASCRERV